MPELGDHVLVNDVVYKLCDPINQGCEEDFRWTRVSVPPEYPQPGRQAQWPSLYRRDQLPAHEVISAEQAREIEREAFERFE